MSGIGAAGGDVFGLSDIDANTLVVNNQAFSFIGLAGFSAAGQLQVSNSGGDTVIRGNVDSDLAAELEIRVQDGTATAADYAAGDFIL